MWLRTRVQKCGGLTASQKRVPPSRRRIGLECLEDRTVLSTFHIANGDVAGLISAFHMADSNNQDNTIILAQDGDYVLGAIDNTSDGPTGLPVVATGGYSLTIEARGATISRNT